MKKLFAFLLLIYSVDSYTQSNIRVFAKTDNRKVILYADNMELCNVSIELELVLDNLNSADTDKKIFVMPGNTTMFKLTELNIVDRSQQYKYSYRYRTTFGDVNLTTYDTAYKYDLPYKKRESFLVIQGYNGRFSHQNENALDFSMPEGTEILAAREGIVVAVIQNNSESCPEEECQKLNNYILVYHSDGTIAAYQHIKFNGSAVKVGDKVKKGDLIAYSGNTGWSSGPHLHFVCFIGGFENRKTIATAFRIKNGSKFDFLRENEVYRKNY